MGTYPNEAVALEVTVSPLESFSFSAGLFDGTSAAYFLDLGSGIDDFGSERNANELYVFDDYAFFVDAESTAAAIMKAKAGEIRNGKDEVE